MESQTQWRPWMTHMVVEARQPGEYEWISMMQHQPTCKRRTIGLDHDVGCLVCHCVG